MRNLKNFFTHPRHLLQAAVLLVTIGIGLQFYVYVQQASGTGSITVQRPPGVEGFLPIGALMGWKQFLITGRWDPVHPAAMVILGWAVLISFAFRKAFCGWFCPIGTVSEWCWRIGRRLFGRNYALPGWLDWILRTAKYALLGFFLWVIFMMSADQIAAFMQSPYYKLSDVKMLHFFTRISTLTVIVLVVLFLLSLLVKNFWCRYLCPYGALLGLFAMTGPTGIRRDAASCTGCQRCDQGCPAHLPVSRKRVVRSPECTACMTCVAACPCRGTLGLHSMGIARKTWSRRNLGLLVALSFILTVYTASVSGFWRSGVKDHELRMRLQTIDAPAFTHPSIGDLKP